MQLSNFCARVACFLAAGMILPGLCSGQSTARKLNPHRLSKIQRLRLQRQWFMAGRRTRDGKPPAWNLQRARRQARRLPFYIRPERCPLYSSGPAESTAWTFQGPQPINTFQAGEPFGDDGNVSGIVSTFAVDLANDPTGNTIYVGTTYGGVWKSTNALAASPTFTPLSDQVPSLDIGAIALGPDNAQGQPMLYAGTGKWIQDFYQGLGIEESSDGGKTWNLISSADGGKEQFAGLSVTRILVDPVNPQIVLMSAALSADSLPGQAENANPILNNQPGIYRSTDGGQTWALDEQGANCADMAYDASTKIYYAAFQGYGVYASTDQGNSWTALADPFANGTAITNSNFNVASLAAGQGRIYALIANDQNGYGNLSMPIPCANPTAANPSGCDTGLVVSSDGGQTWTPLPVPGNDSDGYTDSNALFCEKGTAGADCQGDYDQDLGLTPDGHTLILGGIDVWALNLSSQAYTQVTSGETNLGGQVHPDQHAFAAASNTGWFVGNDGGVWSTTDAGGAGQGSDWNNLNSTLGVTTLYSVAQAEDSSNTPVPVGGAQDNGTDIAQNGAQWQQLEGGDGGWTAADPNNQQNILGMADGGGPGGTGLIVTAANNPMDNYGIIVDRNTITDWANGGPLLFPFQFEAAMPKQIAVGSNCRVWVGPDQIDNSATVGNPATGWMAISNDLTQYNGPADCSSAQSLLTALAVAPSSADTIYAGALNGKLWATANATCISASSPCSLPTWTEIDSGLPGNTPISSIAVNPTQPQTVLVSLCGYGTGHVFLSSNGGTAWTDISGTVGSGGLPDAPVNDIVLDPSNSKDIYAATDVGVFVITDGGAAGGGEQWQQLGPGLPDCPVIQLQFSLDTKTLIAASFGRGAWTIPALGAASGSGNAPDFSLTLSPAKQSVAAGAGATLTVASSALNGDTAAITLSCTAPASGCAFSPASVAPGASSTLTIVTSALASGGNTITISGTDGTHTHTASATITVSAAAGSGSGFTGNLVAVAGGGATPPSTTAEAANQAQLTNPTQLAADAQGNVYMLDQDGSEVEKYDPAAGTLTVIAGCGINGGCKLAPTASPTPATMINLYTASNYNGVGLSAGGAMGLAVDNHLGVLLIADTANNTVDAVSLANDNLIAIAGCLSGGGACARPTTSTSSATDAGFQSVEGVAVDAADHVYISDTVGNVMYMFNPTSTPTVQVIAGGGQSTISASPQAATAVGLGNPVNLTADGAGNIYIATDLINSIEVDKFNIASGQIQIWAGDGSTVGNSASATPQPATNVGMNLAAITADSAGNLYIASTSNVTASANQVFRVDTSGNLMLLAGSGGANTSYTPQLATSTNIKAVGLALDGSGNLYLADIQNQMLAEMPVTAPAAKPDFQFSSIPASQSVNPGSFVSYTLTVAPQGGFNSTVNLSCAGAPSEATCTLSPASVTLDGTHNSSVTVTVGTTAASALPGLPAGGGRAGWFWLLLLLPALACIINRRRWARLAGMALLAAACAGCGGAPSAPASSPAPSNPGTATGTYTLTITGTSGSLSHSASLSLTVN